MAATIRIAVLSDARNAIAGLRSTGREVETTGKKFGKLGKVAGPALLAGLAGVVAFGKKSANTFVNMTKAAAATSRVTGLTVENASRLNFAFGQMGVSQESAAKGLRKFGTFAVNNAKASQILGFSVRDANGKLLGMDKLLPKLADKFKSMPNGLQKTALAQQLFGKTGTDLIPVLNKGAAGLKELAAKSDALGNTISGKDAAAVRTNAAAQRTWQATLVGLQVVLGRQVMPLITKFTGYLLVASKFVSDHRTVLVPLIGVFAGLAVALKVVAIAQGVLNTVMAANPYILIAVGVIALIAVFVLLFKKVSWFHTGVMAVWNAIKKGTTAVFGFISNYFKGQFAFYKGLFVGIVTTVKLVWNGLAWIATRTVAIFVAVRNAISGAVASVRAAAGRVVDAVKAPFVTAGTWLVSAGSSAVHGLASGVTSAVHFVTDGIATIQNKITGFFSGAGHWLWDAGAAIIRGLIDGIKSSPGAIVDAIKGIAGKFARFLPGSPVREGPLKILNNGRAGKAIVRQLVAGMNAATGLLRRQADATAAAALGSASAPISPAALAGARTAGAAPIVVNLAVPPVADPAEVGRQVVKALKAYAGSTSRSIVVNA
jgi:hypothetical protein